MEAPPKQQALPSGTVTFLMTDLEGSTRLWELYPEAMRIALGTHDHIIKDAVQVFGGHLLKERAEGDSHFAVFARAADALGAAMEAQQRLAKENWPSGVPMRVRMAIHSGDADLRGADYYGPAVNRCARIRAAAHGGQVLLSESSRQLVAKAMPNGSRLKDHGLQRLKDLLTPERLYELMAEGMPADLPKPKTLDLARHNLPVQLTSFIGRERELADLKRLLFKHRLVTLTGTGGAGKTRLALQLAAETADEFPQGVWFVELVGLTDGKLVGQSIAAALHIAVSGQEPLEALINELREDRALLLLDNCEHLVRDAAHVVNRLVRECPHLTVLATSREPMSVVGECSYLVPPLEVDLKGRAPDIETVGALDSVKLFCDRAAARVADPVLTDKSATAVQKLCQRLDGIPLAIEQAASNLDYLSPRQILDRLEQHLSLLSVHEEGQDARHVTLQATIDWSYGMLSEQERLLFRRLSVFVGGFSLEAAESVCGCDGLTEMQIMPLVERLVRKSLVVAEQTSQGEKRFRLLETVREYGARKRSEHPEESGTISLERRYFDWFHHLVLAVGESSLHSGNSRLLHLLESEHDNIRSALSWSISQPEGGADAIQICLACTPFWRIKGYFDEAVGWFRKALVAGSDCPKSVQAKAYHQLGVLALLRDRYETAEEAITASISAFRELDDVYGQATAMHTLGVLHQNRGKAHLARDLLEAALRLLEPLGDKQAIAKTTEALSFMHADHGDKEQALVGYHRALAFYHELNDTSRIVHVAVNLLELRSSLGELVTETSLLTEATGLLLEQFDPITSVGILDILGEYWILKESEDLGVSCLGAADRVLEDMSFPRTAGETRYYDRVVSLARSKLDSKAYTRAHRTGHRAGAESLLRKSLEVLNGCEG